MLNYSINRIEINLVKHDIDDIEEREILNRRGNKIDLYTCYYYSTHTKWENKLLINYSEILNMNPW